jgi:hypothetical protein
MLGNIDTKHFAQRRRLRGTCDDIREFGTDDVIISANFNVVEGVD